MQLVGGDLQVPLVTGEWVRYANLDNAASAPALRVGRRRGRGAAALLRQRAPRRGLRLRWSAPRRTRRAREIVRGFVGAREDDVVLFTRNTTDAFNLLAGALPPARRCSRSRASTTRTCCRGGAATCAIWAFPAQPRGRARRAGVGVARARRAARWSSVTGASNVTGEVWPVEAIARLAHRHGARVALDAAQLAAHRPIDIAAWDVDYVAFSGHKVYAPVRRRRARRARGLARRGRAAPRGRRRGAQRHRRRRRVGRPARHATRAAPRRRSARSRSPPRCSALSETRLGASIQAHEQELLERLLTGLDAIDGVRTYELWGRGHDRVGVVSFNVAGLDPALLAAALGAEHGIGVRDGAFCAHPLMDHFAARRRRARGAREHRRRHERGRHRPAARRRRAASPATARAGATSSATAPSSPTPTRVPARRSAACSAARWPAGLGLPGVGVGLLGAAALGTDQP